MSSVEGVADCHVELHYHFNGETKWIMATASVACRGYLLVNGLARNITKSYATIKSGPGYLQYSSDTSLYIEAFWHLEFDLLVTDGIEIIFNFPDIYNYVFVI
jgi:hypothetical protein